jgi:type I restriction enzyme R subunit
VCSSDLKLRPLLLLKYHNAIADAVADLGPPEQIRTLFAGFQRHLYEAPGSGAAMNAEKAG